MSDNASGPESEINKLRSKCFDLETKIGILEIDLRHAKQSVEGYRRLWNQSTNEAKKLRKQVVDLVAQGRTSQKNRKVRRQP